MTDFKLADTTIYKLTYIKNGQYSFVTQKQEKIPCTSLKK